MTDKVEESQALIDQCKIELPYVTTAFEQLVNRYQGDVIRFSQRYLRNHADAEEVCQDVFIRVFHHLKTFEGRSSFRTWLLTIANNQCYVFSQKEKKHRHSNELFETDIESMHASHEESVEADDTGDRLNAALASLSDRDRSILLLRHINGLSMQEISEVLELNLSATKMRHKRALERCMTLYRGEAE